MELSQVWLGIMNLVSWLGSMTRTEIMVRYSWESKVNGSGENTLKSSDQSTAVRAWSCSSWETEAGGRWGPSYIPRPQKQKTGARHGGPCLWSQQTRAGWSLWVRGWLGPQSEFFQDSQSYVLETNKQTKTTLGRGCRSPARVLA